MLCARRKGSWQIRRRDNSGSRKQLFQHVINSGCSLERILLMICTTTRTLGRIMPFGLRRRCHPFTSESAVLRNFGPGCGLAARGLTVRRPS